MASVAAQPKQSTLPASLSCLRPIILEDLRRYGKGSDGGYLLPTSQLNQIDGVVSFGLSDDWSLENEISELRPGIPIHGYDHTVGEDVFRDRIKFAQRSVAAGFCKLCLFQVSIANLKVRVKTYQDRKSVLQRYNQFFPARAIHFPNRIFNRHEQPADTTIDEVFARVKGQSHLFLKMDIEGGEYRVIPQILNFADSIDLMAIEFHDTEPLREIFLRQIHDILLHFDVIHIHGNNYAGAAADGLPDLLEITFLKKAFLGESLQRRDRLPVEGLDLPNDPAKRDLPLIFAAS